MAVNRYAERTSAGTSSDLSAFPMHTVQVRVRTELYTGLCCGDSAWANRWGCHAGDCRGHPCNEQVFPAATSLDCFRNQKLKVQFRAGSWNRQPNP